MLNKAQIIGNLGADPRVATAKNGSPIASFTIATTERGYTSQSGAQVPEKTEWHNVVCFGKLAEVVSRYLRKGSKVFIEGKMRTRTYTGKDGLERKTTEINAETMEMLDAKPSTTSAPSSAPSSQTQQRPGSNPSQPQHGAGLVDDDYPF